MLPSLRTLVLRSGDRLELADRVTIITGPNNSGKSLLLQEIGAFVGRNVADQVPDAKILSDIELNWPTDIESLLTWLGERSSGWRPPGQYLDGNWPERNLPFPGGGAAGESLIRDVHGKNWVGPLLSWMLLALDTSGRLQHNFGPQVINRRQARPTTPAQYLYEDRLLETRMSNELRRAFSTGLVVDRYAGSEIPLLIGEVTAEETKPPPSDDYLAQLSQLEPLAAQGDGYRAFSNILILTDTSTHKILLIDEPEAFLHPPQARLLGRMLAEKAAAGQQVIVSTHSTDVVEGLTSVRSSDASIGVLRITRPATGTRIARVDPERVRSLYDDALLRYARVLNGLFSDGAVVCEGDSDCTYYEAVGDHLQEVRALSSSDSATRSGVNYVHTGGKARIARAVEALRAAKVPTASIVDFDILKSKDEFLRLVEVHGGSRDALEPLRNVIAAAVESQSSLPSRTATRAELIELIDKRTDVVLTAGELDQLKSMLAPDSDGWRKAKRSGRNSLVGGAVGAFDSLQAQCNELGLFIVPVGELEMFHREVPSGNKPAWLRSVLEQALYRVAKDSADFLADVIDYIRGHQ